jgi:phage terminase large subunit GpA-like protein
VPALLCPRGHEIDLSVPPVPGERCYLDTARWDTLVDAVTTAVLAAPTGDRTLTGEAVSDALAGQARYFYTCPVCGSLAFPDEEPPTGYLPA